MKKKSKRNIIFAVIGFIIVGAVIGYNYSVDQSKTRGFNFGNELEEIQSNLKKLQTDFDTKIGLWQENSITKEEFLEYSKKHLENFEKLILRYDNLLPPKSFSASVELFKLSSQSQLQSDEQFFLWVETEDETYLNRSDALLQESFEFELAALEKFNSAKKGETP